MKTGKTGTHSGLTEERERQRQKEGWMDGGREGRGHAHKRQNNSWYEVRGMGNAGAQKPGEMRRRDRHLIMLA